MMKIYKVSIPVFGTEYLYTEANSEQEAIDNVLNGRGEADSEPDTESDEDITHWKVEIVDEED